MSKWTKRGQKRFEADELNAALLNSLSLEEMLAMMESPSLFTEKREQVQAEANAQCAKVMAQYE